MQGEELHAISAKLDSINSSLNKIAQAIEADVCVQQAKVAVSLLQTHRYSASTWKYPDYIVRLRAGLGRFDEEDVTIMRKDALAHLENYMASLNKKKEK